MEKHLKSSISASTEIPFPNAFREVQSVWGIPHGTGSYHSLSDATLFSSSLPVLRHEKLNFTDPEHFGTSINDGFSSFNKPHQEDDIKYPLDDVEPNAIGSFLPGDEHELLAGVMDDFDLRGLPTQMEDLEDDIFYSGGGMELDFESQENLNFGMSTISISDSVTGNRIGYVGLPNGVATVAGEHPYGEHPSRTLFVRNINSNVEDSELRSLFEQHGDIRTLYTGCKHRGFVMISYYDIRAARAAMRALQNKPLRRRKLDIHFSIPKDNPSEKDVNQGTLVVFNLDASVSNDDLRQIFGAYGEVKEIRETPHKRHHKFIEFYDVRAAEAALKALNGRDIAGKRIKLEPSRPGGARRNLMQQLSHELEQDETRTFRHQVGSPITNSPPGNWAHISSPSEHNLLRGFSHSPGLETPSPTKSDHLSGLASILASNVSHPVKIAPIGRDQGKFSLVNQVIGTARSTQGTVYQHPHSFPERTLSSSPGPVSSFDESNSTSSGFGTLSGPQFLWGKPTPYSEPSNTSVWPTSPVRQPFGSSGAKQGYTKQYSSFVGSHHQHHVGSAPSGIPFERHFSYLPESPEASFMSPVALVNMGLNRSSGSYMINRGACAPMNVGVALPETMTGNGSPSSSIMSLLMNGPIFFCNGSFHGIGTATTEGFAERGQNRRSEYSSNQLDNKKHYQLDLDKIISGEDTRTTLMIKNIPNKYTSKMLLAAIDENHRGTYDFLYLPIDFKNKCNVGYAFINMVSPSHIISFYEVFNGKKWEKFNSEKVASLAYARIQGKAALVTHFQNSSLMNEDKRCRPILFQSEGQETSDQEPLPSSNLNIYIRQPDGSYYGDSLESPSNLDRKSEKNEICT